MGLKGKQGSPWDVFVSHNVRQKPWVREVVAQWRSLGLRVFFDEDSIEPGEPIDEGIERGLKNSRHVVLMISPQSVESPWVALEASLAIYADADAKKRRLIPVIIETTEPETIKYSIRRLNIIDLSDPKSRQARYRHLLEFLGVASGQGIPLIPGTGGGDGRQRRVVPPIRAIRWSVWRGLIVGVSCGVFAWLISLLPLLRGLEEWSQDGCFELRGRRTSAAKVVIVGLDETSLSDLPKPLAFTSPELAEVVTYLHGRGASAIGLDVMVPEDLDDFPGIDRNGKELGRAAALAGNVVLPAMQGSDRLMRPLLVWRTGSPLGLVDLTEDPDHFLRRQQLAFPAGGEDSYQFAVALLGVAGLIDPERPDGRLRVGGRVVPLEPGGLLRINFVGPAGTIAHIPFHVAHRAARGGPPPAESLDRAIVIIGATARNLSDYHAIPYSNGNIVGLLSGPSGLMSGPEVHANIVATLSDGAFITTPWWLSSLPLVVLLGAALGIALARVSLLHGAFLALAHHLAWRGFCLVALCIGPWRVGIVPMLLTGALCYIVLFAARVRLRGRLLGAAKSEAIARALEDDARHQIVKGQVRIVTVLFADIRDFSSFARRAKGPEEIVALLNGYYTDVVPLLEEHGGTIDRYRADELIVLFGAPGEQTDHATRAVRAASAIVTRVRQSGSRWKGLNFPDLRVDVGVHTGPVVIGLIGSPRRLDYSAIGDTIKLGSQIESAVKGLGAEILISGQTYCAMPASQRESLGCASQAEVIEVDGRDETLEVHRVLIRPGGPGKPAGDRSAPGSA
jgi:adenylate cyclase